MGFLVTIFQMMGQVLRNTFTSPLFIIMYGMLFLVVIWQNKRIQKVSEDLVGCRKYSYIYTSLIATLFGIIGGIFGSFLLIFLGIDLAGIAISELWLVAILLMFIQQRFLCFSYAAGVLSVSSLLFSYPEVNIPHLLGLVAVLHMVESLLILLNGSLNPLPVYVKKKKRMMGGFNLQAFWPIPLIAMFSTGPVDPGGGMTMPDWWPLLQNYAVSGVNHIYTLLPVLAVLGYGEITTTRSPSEAARKSSLLLFLFSLCLLLLSVISVHWAVFLPIAAVFSPLGHELVIWLGMRRENNQSPLYVHPGDGLRVLDVLPGSPAHKCGLQTGDTILTVNGFSCLHNQALMDELLCSSSARVQFLRKGTIRTETIETRHKPPGIILAPDSHVSCYLAMKDDTIFNAGRTLWRAVKRFLRMG